MKNLKSLILTSIFLGLGAVLSMLFHLVPLPQPYAAYMFSPLHLPVFICAVACGWKYGLICGVLMPFISHMATYMPPLFPTAISMSMELALYGTVTSLILDCKPMSKNKIINIFAAVILAQISGRLGGGLVSALLNGISGGSYSFNVFVTSYFVKTFPAIILQLILIPPIAALKHRMR